ncbi:MAG: DUF58 domain-containing protein [Methylococcaceae bacterium]|nr:DUF58 domain-containing protein [Methylococcaceae bacterium]
MLKQLYQRFQQVRGRRIFIVPTRFGFTFVLFLILILLGAINYSNSLGHVLCFLLGSLGLVAMLHTYRNIAKIELKHSHAKPVFCGQEITISMVFDNPTPRDSYQIEASSKQDKVRSWNPFKMFKGYEHPQLISQLKPQQTTQLNYVLPAQKRGQYQLGHIRIASEFPLGFYTTWSYFNSHCTALIYPKPEGILPLPSATQQGQNVTSKQTKGLDDFSGFNRYRTGDPIHAIAWKSMAKDNVLRTKQFTSPQGGHLMLDWQDVAQTSSLEARLSQLCLWVLKAESAGMTYGLTLPNTVINYGHGDSHQHHCLAALARYD